MGRNQEVDAAMTDTMRITFEVKNNEAIKTIFLAYVKALPEIVTKNLDEVADKIKEEAQNLVPIDTAALHNSIRKVGVAHPQKNIYGVSILAGGQEWNWKTGRLVDYAVDVEFGYADAPDTWGEEEDRVPQPFMFPAYRRFKKRLRVGIAKDLVRKFYSRRA